MGKRLLKDQVLAEIVQRGGNVAQAITYGPDGKQRFHWIRGVDPDFVFKSIEQGVKAILATGARFVNIRTYTPDAPDGNPFFFGRKGFVDTPKRVAAKVRQMMKEGYYVIINEQIDIMDGGFSGVVFGDVAEFASGHTPRCVDDERVACAVLPRSMLPRLVDTVYGKPFSIPYPPEYRVVFSVHPGPVGYFRQCQVIWQAEAMDAGVLPSACSPRWPNQFSKDMGDKAYGLLMALFLGLNVPRTRVESRILPRFSFGHWTGSKEVKWIRTCPRVQEPGLFTTRHGQIDTFHLVQQEDPVCVDVACIALREKNASERNVDVAVCPRPQHRRLAGIIVQDAVDPLYSGAVITDASGEPIIEGIPGKGDPFMVGERAQESLPVHVRAAVRGVWECASASLGPVRFEWVCDRDYNIVVVQFHRGETSTFGDVLVQWEKEPIRWEVYRTEWGLEQFRPLCERAEAEGFGIVLQTNLGVTNHFVDNLRRHGIASRLEVP
jgi:hypothetical protein